MHQRLYTATLSSVVAETPGSNLSSKQPQNIVQFILCITVTVNPSCDTVYVNVTSCSLQKWKLIIKLKSKENCISSLKIKWYRVYHGIRVDVES